MANEATHLSKMDDYRGEVMAASCAFNLLSLALPITILQVYDRVIPNDANDTLFVFVIGLCIVLILDLMLDLGRSYMRGWTGARVQHRLSCEAVNHTFHSELRAFDAEPPGVHIQRLRDIDSVKTFFGQNLLMAVDLPFALVFFGLIGLIAGPLALVPIAIVLLLAAAAQVAGQRVGAALEFRKETDDHRYNFIIEVLRSIQTVKGLGMEAMMVRRYERLQGSSAEASYNVADSNSWGRNTGQMMSQLTAIAVGAYGSTLVIGGDLTIGGLAACTLLASRSSQPMMRALSTWTQLQNARVTRSRINTMLDLPLESKDEAPAIHQIAGNVVLDDLTFSYSEENPLFSHVDLDIGEGETVAISGPNGSGKSTLLGLMMGLHVPTGGRVLIDGHDVCDHNSISLRSQVIYLPQTPVLFGGTLLENLTMFRGNAYVDAAMHMAERLGLHDAVGRMPQGYETPIEHAANDGLPGGVRQRIALVRALTLVEDPHLILFDEANTFLDQENDGRLLELLGEFRGKATMIVVSHRPSYLELADRRFVIRNRGLEAAPEDIRESLRRLNQELAS